MAGSGTLITKEYKNFRGVDFTNVEVKLYRSPDALNVWRNYKNKGEGITTRPDIELYEEMDNSVYGLFFYEIANSFTQLIVHSGTKLYKIENGTKTQIYSGMNPRKSQFFVFNNILFIKDGINYLEYDGTTCSEVVGYIPTTTISRSPGGGGKTYQDVNLLTGIRKNQFTADGESTVYHLDAESIDQNFNIVVKVNDVVKTQGTDYTVNTSKGTVTFTTAPEAPDTDGQDNVIITYRKTIPGNRERINKCTLLEVFDNRVFFAGNQDYPNALFHSSLENPRYVSDLDYYNEGMDLSPIKALMSGNNALWVVKEPSQSNCTVFYHIPTTDSEYGQIYPNSHSNIAVGCTATGINFNDDIVFFSDNGMESISGDISTEQLLSHKSTMIDSKLISQTNYNKMILEEWEGYLLVFIDKKVFLADSRGVFTNIDHNEYEWFYWELDKTVTCTRVKDGVLYIGTTDGIYTMTKTNTEIEAYWTTPLDEFNYPQMQKTTNKRGCVADMEGEKIQVEVKIDNKPFELIKEYINTKGYVVPRIKKKKWKGLQMKFSSVKPFSLYSCTLEAYVGSYVKR
jgi:hypothetical protein